MKQNIMIKYNVATKLFIYLFRNQKNLRNYESNLRKEIDCCYSPLISCAKRLEGLGFLVRENKSNRKYLKLTTKGKIIAQYLDKLDRLLK